MTQDGDLGGIPRSQRQCGNDEIALGAMHGTWRLGTRPGQVSIVAFDDTPLARFYTPALTTVRQFKALGKLCVANLSPSWARALQANILNTLRLS